MLIWYDFEFLERGPEYPIIPISLGMVREDGEELYVINGEFPLEEFVANDWLRDNVVPHLPVRWVTGSHIDPETGALVDGYEWDEDHPDWENVWSLRVIADKVEEFVLGGDGSLPELWGWYPSHDHVCLTQLFGRMTDLPAGFPMRTNCLQQVADMMGITIDESRGDDEHHALEDALWTRNTFIDLMNTAMQLTIQAFGQTVPRAR